MCRVLWLSDVPVLWFLSRLSRFATQQRLCFPKILGMWTFTILCLLFISIDLPYSKFHNIFGTADYDFNTVKRVNDQRRVAAHQYLSQIHAGNTRTRYLRNGNSGKLRYAIGVVSVARKSRWVKLEYLTQVMSKLDQIIVKNNATESVFPFICNTDSNPEKFEEANWLSTYFPCITRVYSKNVVPKTRRRDSVQEKEKQDYVFCLEAAVQYNADYVILLEDDAYPADNFYEVLEHTIRSKLETTIRRGEKIPVYHERWVWVKLCFPYSLADYHRNWYFFCQWIALATLLGGISCLIIHHIYPLLFSTRLFGKATWCTMSNTSRHPQLTFYTFLHSLVYFVFVLGIIGRPYYLELRSVSPYTYSLDPGTSCCTPAMLYSPREIPGIVNYLRGCSCSRRYPLDFALDDYREKSNLKQYLMSPNLFTHIGFYSSLHNNFNGNKMEFVGQI